MKFGSNGMEIHFEKNAFGSLLRLIKILQIVMKEIYIFWGDLSNYIDVVSFKICIHPISLIGGKMSSKILILVFL